MCNQSARSSAISTILGIANLAERAACSKVHGMFKSSRVGLKLWLVPPQQYMQAAIEIVELLYSLPNSHPYVFKDLSSSY